MATPAPTTDKYGHKFTTIKSTDGSTISLVNQNSIFGDQKFMIYAGLAGLALLIYIARG